MSKLLSKEFYGNHYYLNIDSEIGSVSRLAANPWQYHQPSSSPSRQAAVRNLSDRLGTTFHIYVSSIKTKAT